MTDWRSSFRHDPEQQPLGLTESKAGQGEPGIADFLAGTYPACSLHGAMNRVSERQMWRCLQCNIGVEYCEWGAMVKTMGGASYDPNTSLARERRAAGQCGFCGHPAHWTMVGCPVCPPERCPVMQELSPEVSARIASGMRAASPKGPGAACLT